MRVSATARHGKPYWNYIRLRTQGRIDVFLDGVLQKNVFVADDKRGFVVVTALNERGYAYAIGGKVATRKLHGKVTIRVRKGVFCAVR